MIIHNVMNIVIGCRDWNFPKSIITEYTGKSDRINEMAAELFDNYKKQHPDSEYSLINYTYFGTVDLQIESNIDNKSIVLEIDDKSRFERELNKYLNLGYEIASSACNSSFYRAILVKN